MRRRVSRYLIVIGLILTPVFLITYGSLVGRRTRLEDGEALLLKEGKPGFVYLEKAHIQKGALVTHYYFTYQLLSDRVRFRNMEEVSSEYFHSHTEGRNAEVLLYIDEGGLPHAHLRNNERIGYDALPGLMRVSLYGWMSSVALLLVGILLAWPNLNDRFSKTISDSDDANFLN